MTRGPFTPAVLSESELDEIVQTVSAAGEFAFDVETRGHIHRHADVMELIEAEWTAKKDSLKTDHPTTIARSRQVIEDKWTRELALDPLRNEVFWVSIATASRSWAIPMGHPNGEVLVKELRGDGSTVPPPGYRAITKTGKESMAKAKFFVPAKFTDPPAQLSQEVVFSALEPLFLDPDIVKVNQNIKFDAKSVAKYYGNRLPEGLYVDTQVLMCIADENIPGGFSLGNIIDYVFQHDPYAKDGKLGATITTEPFSKACRYAHFDARWAYLTYRNLWRRISRVGGLYDVMMRDCSVLRPVAQMEMNGILVNKREMVNLGKAIDQDLNEAIRDIFQYAPTWFNPSSNADKVKWLFSGKREGGLALKPTKVSEKTGKPSVDEEVLEDLLGKHPVIAHMMEYSEYKKMKSTYIDGLAPLFHRVPGEKYLGRLHPQFHLHRTATGRFSSSDPNLQNIPRDGRVRSLFVAGAEDSLVVADYSQIEMRLMAMFSQDPELLRIFSEGIDVHTGTATVILGREPTSSEERNIYGKVPNFLMGYGGGAKRLIVATKGAISLDEAKSIVEGYNKGYAGLSEWKERELAKGRKRGYVETMGGRRRRVPNLTADSSSRDGWAARSKAERQAINAIVQGTAAEICKDAMIKLDGMLDFPTCKMLIQVHDELVISVPTEQLVRWVPVVESCMGNGTWLDNNGQAPVPVQLEVEAHFARSWSEAKG
jgi:DNA polymerase I-like protein with 3'-5' exonuclease and polymerase domains